MKKTEDIIAEIKKVFSQPNEKVAIFIGSPDPDSIGSGMGIKFLLQNFNKSDCTIVYSGEISHPQNRTLVNVLNIELIEQDKFFIDNKNEVNKKYSKFVWVDHVPREKLPELIKPTLIIDHHKSNYDKNGAIVDIRNVGSCCSIVWEYIKNSGYKLSADKESDAKIAIAMLFGIKTDTGDLIADNTTDLDFAAYQDLSVIVKENNISDIINYKYPAYFFEVRSRLDEEGNSIIKDSFFIGGIEFISPVRRDCLPMLADERLRMEGISTAIVFAIVGENLEASVRSNNPAIDVNKLCKDIFGEDYAGGRIGAGAARVPLGILSSSTMTEEDKKTVWPAYRSIILHKILHYCGGH